MKLYLFNNQDIAKNKPPSIIKPIEQIPSVTYQMKSYFFKTLLESRPKEKSFSIQFPIKTIIEETIHIQLLSPTLYFFTIQSSNHTHNRRNHSPSIIKTIAKKTSSFNHQDHSCNNNLPPSIIKTIT